MQECLQCNLWAVHRRTLSPSVTPKVPLSGTPAALRWRLAGLDSLGAAFGRPKPDSRSNR